MSDGNQVHRIPGPPRYFRWSRAELALYEAYLQPRSSAEEAARGNQRAWMNWYLGDHFLGTSPLLSHFLRSQKMDISRQPS